MSTTKLVNDPLTLRKKSKPTVRRQKVKPNRVPLAHTLRKQAKLEASNSGNNEDLQKVLDSSRSLRLAKSTLDQTMASYSANNYMR